MNLAMRTYQYVENPLGVPINWPAQTQPLAENEALPEGLGWQSINEEAFTAYKALHQETYDTWYAVFQAGQAVQADPQLSNTERNIGTILYYTSCFDNNTTGKIGEGEIMRVALTNQQAAGETHGVFLEDIELQEGFIKYENAPDGALVSLDVVCPAGSFYLKDSLTNLPCASDLPTAVPAYAYEDVIVMRPINNVAIYGSNRSGEILSNINKSLIPVGYQLCLKAKNAEIKAAFIVWIRLKAFRKTTIN
jgi:hypothetical protein